MRRFLLPVLALMCAGLSACSTMVPEPLAGNSFADVTIGQAQSQPEVMGLRVRWGGTIARTTPGPRDTCFEVVNRPLDEQARPELDDRSDGRFMACLSGFYDPEVYAPKREITVIGTLQAPAIGKIGNHDYVYPKVAVDTLYLWPRRVMQPFDPAMNFGPDPFMFQYQPWLLGPMGPMEPWGMGW
ncbi:MAG: Slp family lipoprotein [Betaproteobacteria bacterium]|nr:Slp family lipoprotein [Betaproteobacteria bacterium]